MSKMKRVLSKLSTNYQVCNYCYYNLDCPINEKMRCCAIDRKLMDKYKMAHIYVDLNSSYNESNNL